MQRLRPATDGGFVGQLALFLGLAVIAGLLTAGLALPLTGGLGFLTRSGVSTFESLPSDLEIPELPQRSRIVDAAGNTIATFYFENRITVPLTQIAPVMRQALVDIEDSRFYEHGGLDLRGTLRAFVSNQSSGQTQGGSTLTQQYVKNVLVEKAYAKGDRQGAAAARAVDYGRKVQELRFAIAVEEKYDKDQILERYLNIAYFGGGAYGIEAAARHYFSKPAKDLTLPEAALLAGLVRSPYYYDPVRSPKRAMDRRNTVISRMQQLGHITPDEAAAAKARKLGLKIENARNGCPAATYPFFCDYVQRVLLTDPAFGRTAEERAQFLRRGGLTIKTTLNPKVQKAAQKAVDAYVKADEKVAAAIAMVQPGTGKVLAIAQSKRYGQGKGRTTVNYAVDKQYGASGGFQAGSTFKPFVAAAAIQKGYPLDYRIQSPYKVKIGDIKTCDGRTLKDTWEPSNELTTEHGNFTMAQAAAKSINTYFAQLEQRVGVCDPWRVATELGVTNSDGSKLSQVKSFTLGVATVSPLTMAEAYATFAARGVHCAPEAVVEVTDRSGKQVVRPQPRCSQALDQGVADGVNTLLQGTLQPGGTGGHIPIGRPAAGKTGTTTNRVAVWFDGYTPDLAAAVWAGNPDDSTYHLRNVRIGGRYYRTVCGGCLPGPIWQQAMQGALKGVPPTPFNTPDPKVVNGVSVTVPSVVGMSPSDAAKALSDVGLLARVSGEVYSTGVPAGAVAGTSPPAGTPVSSGTEIMLQISNGQAPPPPPPPSNPAPPPTVQPSTQPPQPPAQGAGRSGRSGRHKPGGGGKH